MPSPPVQARGRPVPHFEAVDLARTRAQFFQDRTHRATLHVPFKGRDGARTLCIIGQNPSAADERESDKTIAFMEQYVHRTLPEYGQILVLNLFSRVDTKKKVALDPLDPECARIFEREVRAHEDFLVIFGKLADQGAYRFHERARQVRGLLAGKHVRKLALGTAYAPHPGNIRIFYRNFDLGLDRYDFADVEGGGA